jgi:hypothetical protein
LVEKGNKVVPSGTEGESYILNELTKVKAPVKKKGGSFVVEAHFVKDVVRDCQAGMKSKQDHAVGPIG